MELHRQETPDHPVRRQEETLASPSPGPAGTSTATLQLVISSSTGLPDQAFTAQKEMLRRVAGFDPATHLWHARITPGNMEWAVKVLSTLFEAARLYGTTIQVQALPAAGDGAPGQAPAT